MKRSREQILGFNEIDTEYVRKRTPSAPTTPENMKRSIQKRQASTVRAYRRLLTDKVIT